MSDKIKGIVVKFGGDTTEVSKALKEVNSQSKSVESQLKAVNKALKLDPKNTELVAEKQKLLKEAIGQTTTKLDVLKQEQEKLQEVEAKGGKVPVEQMNNVKAAIQNTETELKKLKDELKDTSVWTQFGEEAKKVGQKTVDVGESLTKNVTAPIVAVGAASVAAFNELDDAMDTITTKTGASGAALKELQDTAKDIATTIPTSFQTAGDAVGEVSTRFHSTGQELSDLSTQFIEFAKINNSDVSTSVDNASMIMEQFNLTAADAPGLLGQITASSQATGVSTDTLMQSLQNNGAALRSMGLDASQSITLLTNFSQAGIDDETAMKAMSKAAQNYSKDGKNVAEGMKTLVAGVQDGTVSYDQLADVVGTKNAMAFQDMAKSGRLSLDDLDTSLSDYGDTVNNTFNETLDPIDQFTTTLNSLKVLGAEIGNSLMTVLQPVLQQLAESLKGITKWFTSLSPQTQQAIIKAALLAAAIGPILIGVGKLIIGIGGVADAIPKVMTIVSGIGPVVSTVIGGIQAGMTGLWAAITAIPVVGWIIAAIAALVLLYNKCEWFRNLVNTIAQFIWNLIKTIGTSILNFFTGLWQGIQNVFKNVGQWFENVFRTAYKGITQIFQNIGSWFGDRWNDIKNAYNNVNSWFSDKFSQARDGIHSAFQNIGSWMGDRCSDIKNAYQTIDIWMGDKFKASRTSIYDAFTGVGDWFKNNVIDKIKEKFSSFSLLDVGKDIADSLVRGIQSIKLPTMHITWDTESKSILGVTVKVPVPKITWNAVGGILTSPTLFGYAGGSLQGGGEAGPEAVLPLNDFYSNMKDYVSDAVQQTRIIVQQQTASTASGGDFNQYNTFMSPKAIDASEAARQTRNATREMIKKIKQ